MTALNQRIDALTAAVVNGNQPLDDALTSLEAWLSEHGRELTGAERKTFSASLDVESTNDDRSLVDSVLKLHATRLLFRLDHRARPTSAPVNATPYAQARTAFDRALAASEDTINEARIDIAVANAHHLRGNGSANRRWLDIALDRLPDLAAIDLVALAEAIPAKPLPPVGPLRRIGLKLMGFNFDRLDQNNRASLVTIAHMQISQVAILAYLLGTSYETIHERPRAQRAFRVAAHLIVRHNGLRLRDADQLLDIADSLRRAEPDAARLLAQQARGLFEQAADAAGAARAAALLINGT